MRQRGSEPRIIQGASSCPACRIGSLDRGKYCPRCGWHASQRGLHVYVVRCIDKETAEEVEVCRKARLSTATQAAMKDRDAHAGRRILYEIYHGRELVSALV